MPETDRAFHDELLVVDGLSAGGPYPDYIPKLREGGVDAMVSTIGWMQGTAGTFRDIEFLYQQVAACANDVTVVTSVAEIEAAHAAGKIAIILESQNTRLIEDDERLLDSFHRVGIRTIQLTYNEANLVGDGATEPRNAGMTEFGVAVVRRMNKLGILIDCSHTGRQTTLDAMALSEVPVVFSHANALALCANPRNIDDEQIEACARTGGVIGVNAFAPFVKLPDPTSATIEDYLDHVDYMVSKAGIDHVGIGLDLTEGRTFYVERGVCIDPNWSEFRSARVAKPHAYPIFAFAQGLQSIVEMPNVTKGLLARGYSRDDVAKIMGGNWLRVYRRVWGA
jgi:membrane dipeptidase